MFIDYLEQLLREDEDEGGYFGPFMFNWNY